MEGFTARFSNVKKKRGKRGRVSGGVAVYVRKDIVSPFNVRFTRSAMDDVIWVSFQGPTGRLVAVAMVYNPDESSVYCNPEFFDDLEDDMSRIENLKPGIHFIVMGDMNARTGSERDYIEHEDRRENDAYETLNMPEIYIQHDPPQNRSSQDAVVNAWGRKLLDVCKSGSLLILNGRMEPDLRGQATCLPHTGGSSVVDYGLVSREALTSIAQFEILTDFVETTHFPISLEFDIPLRTIAAEPEVEQDQSSPVQLQRFIMKEDEKYRFQEAFLGVLVIVNILCMFMARTGRVEKAVDCFIEFVHHAARSCRVIKKSFERRGRPWFDAGCKRLRSIC